MSESIFSADSVRIQRVLRRLRLVMATVGRELLSWAFFLSTACAILFFPRLRLAWQDWSDAEGVRNEICHRQAFLHATYGMSVQFHTRDAWSRIWGVAGEDLSPAQRLAALHWLECELKKYPAEFLQVGRPQQITLIKNLESDGERVGGLAVGQRAVYISVGGSRENWFNLGGWLDSCSFALTFHHEIFHIADFRDGGDDNPDWIALNRQGGGDYRGTGWDKLEERPKGFARAYGTKNANEDQATVAEGLMCDPDSIEKLSESDHVLAMKIARCKLYYLRWSKGRMNHQFWPDLAEGCVNDSYWSRRSL